MERTFLPFSFKSLTPLRISICGVHSSGLGLCRGAVLRVPVSLPFPALLFRFCLCPVFLYFLLSKGPDVPPRSRNLHTAFFDWCRRWLNWLCHPFWSFRCSCVGVPFLLPEQTFFGGTAPKNFDSPGIDSWGWALGYSFFFFLPEQLFFIRKFGMFSD